MIRFGEQIRLTSQEKTTLSLVAGFPVDPKSVAEHNAIVARAKRDLAAIAAATEPDPDEDGVDHSGHADAKLLAALADGLLVAD